MQEQYHGMQEDADDPFAALDAACEEPAPAGGDVPVLLVKAQLQIRFRAVECRWYAGYSNGKTTNTPDVHERRWGGACACVP